MANLPARSQNANRYPACHVVAVPPALFTPSLNVLGRLIPGIGCSPCHRDPVPPAGAFRVPRGLIRGGNAGCHFLFLLMRSSCWRLMAKCHASAIEGKKIHGSGATAMTTTRSDRPTRYSSSAVALVECSVRVSSTLARLIRKSADKEANGASATEALLWAAGIQPGEVATLHKKLELVSQEASLWREKAAREHGQFEQSRTVAAERDKEGVLLRNELRKTTETLKEAQQRILTFEARNAELSAVLESRDKQLASSLSVSGLADGNAAAMRALRDRLSQGDIEMEATIANLGRPEMRALSNMLPHRTWRLHIIRWLLQIPAGS
jgi:hypothetical protein